MKQTLHTLIESFRADAGPRTKLLLTAASLFAFAFAAMFATHDRYAALVEHPLAYDLVVAGYMTVGLTLLGLRGAADGFFQWGLPRARQLLELAWSRSSVARPAAVVAIVALVVVSASVVPFAAMSSLSVSAENNGVEYAFSDANGNLKYADGDGNVVDAGIDNAASVGGIGQMDDDDAYEIVYDSSSTGNVHIADTAGNDFNTGLKARGIGDIYDWDDDGQDEALVTNSNTLKVLESDGTTTDTAATSTTVNSPVSEVADFDGDGTVEVAYMASGPSINTIQPDGTIETVSNQGSRGLGGIGDFDGDGTQELAFAFDASSSDLTVVEPDGTTETIVTGDGIPGGMSDFDDDGTQEIVYTDGTNILFAEPDGSTVDTGFDTASSGGVGLTGDPDGDVGPSTTISGTVTDADGTKLRGVDLTLKDSSGATVATATTNTNGDYSIGIGNGDYTLNADATGYSPVTNDVEIAGSSKTVNFELSEGFDKTVRLDDAADKFDDPELVVFEYTAADVRQLEGGPYSQPEVWSVTSRYQLDGGETTAKLTAGEQYAFRVIESGTDSTTVAEEYPYYAENDGEPVVIETADVGENETVATEQTADGTRVTYDGPTVDEFTYELPNGYNETVTFDEPTDYYSTTVGENVTNATDSSGGELEYSGTYANGTSFNGSSIYDSSALSFGPTGGSSGGSGGGASSGVALGILGLLGAAAYARFGNGEIGRLASTATDAVRGLF